MHQYPFLQVLLAPLSFIYGLGASLHELLYRQGFVKASKFDTPTIVVGNLSVGGTGKTPHVEYLLDFLQPYIKVGILSRGYRRKTEGFQWVLAQSTVEQVGDEPLQYVQKFPQAVVAVAEERAFAIPFMVGQIPDLQCIILDDAFQHRAVQAGFYILLTEYSLPFTRDYLLPSGRLREWRSAYQRADIIIVTKCPDKLDAEKRADLEKEIRPLPHQKIFFSYFNYSNPYLIQFRNTTIPLHKNMDIVLICAIARTDYLLTYLRSKARSVRALEYPDHHFFKTEDIDWLKKILDNMPSHNKVVITTEKDATRLLLHKDLLQKYGITVFVLPIKINFHNQDEIKFQSSVVEYLESVSIDRVIRH